MIEATGIYKRYGDTQVLRGIDLRIPPRAITCIVGPSGAGKTTLLQIIGTLMRPDRGTVRFGTTDTAAMGDADLSRFRCRNIGFVFQTHRLLPEFTLAENVALPAMIAGERRHTAMARATDLLGRLGLGHRATHRPAQLSGGESQRGAVARALINDPRVILADEPSGSLDTANRAQLHALFYDLRDQLGKTMVIVTHDNTLAAGADNTITMADGKIIS